VRHITVVNIHWRDRDVLFETGILQAATAAIPQTRFSEKISVLWWSAESDRAIKKHAFNRIKRTRSQIDIIIFKRCQAKARRAILAAKETSWRHYCSSITNNSKLAKVWRTIATFSGKRTSTYIPALTHNGITGRNDRHKAHILASHYASCNVDTHYPSAFFTKLPQLQVALQLDKQLTVPTNPRLNEPFSLTELQAVIKSAPDTAPGNDNICYQMFKHTKFFLSKKFSNYSTDTGVLANYPQAGSTL